MKQYNLKKNQPAFDVVDGPMAGRKFTHGQVYTESQIPAADLHKFSDIKPVSAKAASNTKGAK